MHALFSVPRLTAHGAWPAGLAPGLAIRSTPGRENFMRDVGVHGTRFDGARK